MSSRRVVAPLCLLVLLASPAAGQGAPEMLVLHPGDAVRVQIRDEPELSGDFPVIPSGEVLLPLIGLVPAADLPFDRVEEQVRAGYARVLAEPALTVTPVLRIAVLGEVQQPGLFPIDPTHSLGDVLATAGGLTPAGDPDRITLVRGGGEMRLRIARDGDELRTRLRSGDQIVVGKRGWIDENVPVLVGAGASVLAAALTSLLIR